MAIGTSVRNDKSSRAAELTMPAPRVYVVSEVRLFREGLNGMLVQQGELKVVGQGSRSEALAELGALRPEVALLDAHGNDCRVFCHQALLIIPDLRVVAVAIGELDTDVMACIEAGISGYVPRDGSVEDVVRAVTCALAGEALCSPRLAASLFSRLASLSSSHAVELPGATLTLREREIAELVARGLPNKEIARRLRLGYPTVKNHVHNILQKLNLQRRGEIAVLRFGAEGQKMSAH
jgi:two-component system, NarL family, nitrate/nitrite response regulator NarL